jgi:hypothetical protein
MEYGMGGECAHVEDMWNKQAIFTEKIEVKRL